MTDKFFTQTNCDRCGGDLGKVRTMSWFTEECICSRCKSAENEIRSSLDKEGVDTSELEGCGVMPEIA